MHIYGRVWYTEQEHLYLEKLSGDRYVTIDTVSLSENGAFRFEHPKTSAGFYAIRGGSNIRLPFIASDRDVHIRVKTSDNHVRVTIGGTPEPTDFFPVQWLLNKIDQPADP